MNKNGHVSSLQITFSYTQTSTNPASPCIRPPIVSSPMLNTSFSKPRLGDIDTPDRREASAQQDAQKNAWQTSEKPPPPSAESIYPADGVPSNSREMSPPQPGDVPQMMTISDERGISPDVRGDFPFEDTPLTSSGLLLSDANASPPQPHDVQKENACTLAVNTGSPEKYRARIIDTSARNTRVSAPQPRATLREHTRAQVTENISISDHPLFAEARALSWGATPNLRPASSSSGFVHANSRSLSDRNPPNRHPSPSILRNRDHFAERHTYFGHGSATLRASSLSPPRSRGAGHGDMEGGRKGMIEGKRGFKESELPCCCDP